MGSGVYKIFIRLISSSTKTLSASEPAARLRIVYRGLQLDIPGSERCQTKPSQSASHLDCLLATARLWSTRGCRLQRSWIWTRRSSPRNLGADQRWHRNLRDLDHRREECSWLRTRRVEGPKQARDDRNRLLHYLDDFHDDSAKYCVIFSCCLTGSVFFSTLSIGRATVSVDGAIFIEDNSVT